MLLRSAPIDDNLMESQLLKHESASHDVDILTLLISALYHSVVNGHIDSPVLWPSVGSSCFRLEQIMDSLKDETEKSNTVS